MSLRWRTGSPSPVERPAFEAVFSLNPDVGSKSVTVSGRPPESNSHSLRGGRRVVPVDFDRFLKAGDD
ncbi:MAG: hypothetical protein CMP27_11795 [Roseibacillus sp.]|nr:hypothetical protein [Roseibacillus sp.]